MKAGFGKWRTLPSPDRRLYSLWCCLGPAHAGRTITDDARVSRAFASEPPNTVRKAYSELGILDTQQGTGTFVSHCQVEIGPAEKEPMLRQICEEKG